MKNILREKWLQGEPVIGTLSQLLSPVAVEAIAVAGMDYVLLDMEHCPINTQELSACITAADAAGITPLVRTGDVSRAAILRALDVGAMGIVVPGIESLEQAKTLIQYAKFFPLGNRGYCMTRDGKWGFSPAYSEGLEGYMETCNRETLLIPQCETVGCLEHIEEIAALEGVDGIMVGPYDLSMGMGIAGQFSHPDFVAAVERILKACKDNGKISMIFSGDEADMKTRLDQGFNNVLFGLDILSLIKHYSNVADSFRAITGAKLQF